MRICVISWIRFNILTDHWKKRKEDKEEGKISPKPAINTEDKSSTLKPIDVTVVFEDFEDFVSMAKEASGEFNQSVLNVTADIYIVFHHGKPEEVGFKMALIREYAEFSRISWAAKRIRRSDYARSKPLKQVNNISKNKKS